MRYTLSPGRTPPRQANNQRGHWCDHRAHPSERSRREEPARAAEGVCNRHRRPPRGAADRLHGRLRRLRRRGRRQSRRRGHRHGRRPARQVPHPARALWRGRPRHPRLPAARHQADHRPQPAGQGLPGRGRTDLRHRPQGRLPLEGRLRRRHRPALRRPRTRGVVRQHGQRRRPGRPALPAEGDGRPPPRAERHPLGVRHAGRRAERHPLRLRLRRGRHRRPLLRAGLHLHLARPPAAHPLRPR
ncbi:hypothetical protein SGPA1_12769 [Streptomyces misionensis JCM 4497]